MHNNILVLQSDFGLVDGAVSAMVGVALEESPTLKIHHLTHDITPYNIFEGSYRLFQTVDYWPEGTTFVSVDDPSAEEKCVARALLPAEISEGCRVAYEMLEYSMA